ncbi:MAG: hypothetical protein NUV82_03515 [Candidatus Komeilibacteria bacterium]|nr:hypothetical protein [Candidatus Komeilibacteria bacterium]
MSIKLLTPKLALLLLSLIMLLGAVSLWSTRVALSEKTATYAEALRPAVIEITVIPAPDCPQCTDSASKLQTIESQEVKISSSTTLEASAAEAKEMMSKYEITRLPAIIVTGEYNKANISPALFELGAVEREQSYVFEPGRPVYYDTLTGQTVGLMKITYLGDEACEECYDPRNHRPILEKNFGAVIDTESFVDVGMAEGKKLISQYNITELPTVILTGDANKYPGLEAAWKGVGTVESDGAFVFRKNSALGKVVYRDLQKNILVRPAETNQ